MGLTWKVKVLLIILKQIHRERERGGTRLGSEGLPKIPQGGGLCNVFPFLAQFFISRNMVMLCNKASEDGQHEKWKFFC